MSGHPAVDIVTAKSAVVIQDRALTPMSSWLSDVAARTADGGLVMQVLTPHDGRITLPLRMVLGGPRARWVVQEPGDGYFDGFSGLPLTWDGAAFVLAPQAKDGPSETFLRPDGDVGRHLVVDLRVVHEAATGLELGSVVESAAEALAGAAPACWGTAEPALSRWDRAEVTALCRRRAPQATWLVFMGGHGEGEASFGGTVRVSRVTSGVKESITFAVALPGDAPPPLDALEALAARHAAEGTLLTMTAQWTPGRADLTYPARWLGRPDPLALAVGPSGVADTGLDHALAAEVPGRVIGPSASPGVWYGLADAEPGTGWTRLGGLMRHLAPQAAPPPGADGKGDGG
ncbi:DUF6177 family protein [Actinomadura fibrosa]|uniref:DUF6177 family protein n=1 Tax=Actinomadura fibrosa TaxID=111802 RepID=A0ABW2XJV5_9ACTN|nr:DUF6177 family protein [Actinomadura fibrosa]